AGAAAHVGQGRLRPAGHALDGVVAAGGADDGADDDAPVHAGGDLGEGLADLDAGDVGGDGLELAADLGRGLGLDVPRVLVGRAPAEEDVDDGLVPAGRRDAAGLGGRLGAEDVGQGQVEGAEGESADAKEAATGDAVAQPRLRTEDGQHGCAPAV